jgi:hypothetical protein
MVITYCFFLSICCVVSAAIYDFLWSMFIMFCFPFLLTLYMYDLSLVCLFICVYLEFGYAGPRCREVDIFSMRAAKPEVDAVQEKEGMDHACPREEGRGEARAGATYGLTTALSRGQAAARIHSPSRSRTGAHNYPLLGCPPPRTPLPGVTIRSPAPNGTHRAAPPGGAVARSDAFLAGASAVRRSGGRSRCGMASDDADEPGASGGARDPCY